jgi:uncharacterized membrane protein
MHVLLNEELQAADCAGVSTIFVARSCDLGGSNEIFVWRKKSKKWFGVMGIVCGMFIFLQLFFVAAAVVVVFGYQRSVKIPMYNI